MNKVNCDVIKDLLPIYIDQLTSDGSNKLIEEHLRICSVCKQLYEQMKSPIETKHIQDNHHEINFLKKIKTNMIKNLVIGLTTVVIIFGILSWVFIVGTRASSDDIAISTRIDRVNVNNILENVVTTSIDGAYLDREWVITLDEIHGNALRVKMEPVYREEENGNRVEIGYILTPYSVPPFIFEANNYSIGYSHIGTEAPTTDFTVTVRLKDKDIVYSMYEEGVFDIE